MLWERRKEQNLEKQKERFINGAVKNGIPKDIAIFIFKKIEPFAEDMLLIKVTQQLTL